MALLTELTGSLIPPNPPQNHPGIRRTAEPSSAGTTSVFRVFGALHGANCVRQNNCKKGVDRTGVLSYCPMTEHNRRRKYVDSAQFQIRQTGLPASGGPGEGGGGFGRVADG